MRRIVAIVVLTLGVAACGQKGPLYLPGQPPKGAPWPPPAAPATTPEKPPRPPGEVPATSDDQK